MRKLIFILIIIIQSNFIIAQNNLTDTSQIDINTVKINIPHHKNNTDTIVIVNQVIVKNDNSSKFWDRILPILGIILTSITLFIVMINYTIDRNYGGWNGWKEFLRLRKNLKALRSEHFELYSTLDPIIKLNPLDYVEKVKENPVMFKYENAKLKEFIYNQYETLNDHYKNVFSGLYENLKKNDRDLISHRIGQNDKFNDEREFFFMSEPEAFIRETKYRLDSLNDKIKKVLNQINDIKIK